MRIQSERESEAVKQERSLLVFKRDDLIQKSRYSLTVQEQRIVLYAMSKIKPTDDAFQEYTFKLRHFMKLCGLKTDSCTELKRILINLESKTWYMETAPNVESSVSWFRKVRINKKEGTISVRFDDDMMPYLLQLTQQNDFYTQICLLYLLPMKSKYGIRLYEILKSYNTNNREWFFEIDKLKERIDATQACYSNFSNFKKKCLDPAVNEINAYTDINVAYVPEYEGRKVTRIRFFMATKAKEDLLGTRLGVIKELDGEINYSEFFENIEDDVRTQFFRDNPR